jgi:hypothetical protein
MPTWSYTAPRILSLNTIGGSKKTWTLRKLYYSVNGGFRWWKCVQLSSAKIWWAGGGAGTRTIWCALDVYVILRNKCLKIILFESACKWRCEASFFARTRYHRGVILLYPLFGGSMGGHNRSGYCGEEKAVGLAVIGIGIRMFGCPAGGLVTVPAEDTLSLRSWLAGMGDMSV